MWVYELLAESVTFLFCLSGPAYVAICGSVSYCLYGQNYRTLWVQS